MAERPEVSVIIPTLALERRVSVIQRALESVLSQQRVRAVPIVVANGEHCDPSLIESLGRDRRVRLIRSEQPGLPEALRAGGAAVDTAWFSALDDDDEYLPCALELRLQALRERPECDTVITRGLIHDGGREWPYPDEMQSIERAPLSALSSGNWLLPGAWLCRTDRVGVGLFEGMPKALECTYLAIQFALNYKPCFVSHPSVIWYRDTPESESKAGAYIHNQLTALDRILELPLPEESQRWFRRVISSTHHSLAERHYRKRELFEAWRWHARSLLGQDGARYMSFSLRLLLSALRS